MYVYVAPLNAYFGVLLFAAEQFLLRHPEPMLFPQGQRPSLAPLLLLLCIYLRYCKTCIYKPITVFLSDDRVDFADIGYSHVIRNVADRIKCAVVLSIYTCQLTRSKNIHIIMQYGLCFN